MCYLRSKQLIWNMECIRSILDHLREKFTINIVIPQMFCPYWGLILFCKFWNPVTILCIFGANFIRPPWNPTTIFVYWCTSYTYTFADLCIDFSFKYPPLTIQSVPWKLMYCVIQYGCKQKNILQKFNIIKSILQSFGPIDQLRYQNNSYSHNKYPGNKCIYAAYGLLLNRHNVVWNHE